MRYQCGSCGDIGFDPDYCGFCGSNQLAEHDIAYCTTCHMRPQTIGMLCVPCLEEGAKRAAKWAEEIIKRTA